MNAPCLSNLLKISTLWKWNAQCEEAFENIKHALCNCDILARPNFKLPFLLKL